MDDLFADLDLMTRFRLSSSMFKHEPKKIGPQARSSERALDSENALPLSAAVNVLAGAKAPEEVSKPSRDMIKNVVLSVPGVEKTVSKKKREQRARSMKQQAAKNEQIRLFKQKNPQMPIKLVKQNFANKLNDTPVNSKGSRYFNQIQPSKASKAKSGQESSAGATKKNSMKTSFFKQL